MSKWQDFQIRRATKIHADAPTRDGMLEFRLTPSQARLTWWAMRCLTQAIRESVASCQDTADYADDLRCHADAAEWIKDFMDRLAVHAEKDRHVIVAEGVCA